MVYFNSLGIMAFFDSMSMKANLPDTRHLMTDIETLSTEANATVLSIGSVAFDPATGHKFDKFYTTVEIKDQMNKGRHVDPGTIAWWFKQSQEARDAIFKDPVSAERALMDFRHFCTIESMLTSSQVYIWGNGNTFDNMILRSMYKDYNIEYPAHYRNDLDLRTFFFMGKQLTDNEIKVERTGVYHNALDDAEYQVDLYAAYLKHAYKR